MAEQAASSSDGNDRRTFETAEGLRPVADTRDGRLEEGDPVTRIGRMLDVVSETFEQLETAAREANDAKDAATRARWADIDALLTGLASDAAATHARLEVHARTLTAQAEASRVHLDESISALKSQLDLIFQQLSRLIDLREQADIHHTGLFGLLLNGQNELRTDIAEIKHWVTRNVLRGPFPEARDTPPASAGKPQPALDLTQAPDAR